MKELFQQKHMDGKISRPLCSGINSSFCIEKTYTLGDNK